MALLYGAKNINFSFANKTIKPIKTSEALVSSL